MVIFQYTIDYKHIILNLHAPPIVSRPLIAWSEFFSIFQGFLCSKFTLILTISRRRLTLTPQKFGLSKARYRPPLSMSYFICDLEPKNVFVFRP